MLLMSGHCLRCGWVSRSRRDWFEIGGAAGILYTPMILILYHRGSLWLGCAAGMAGWREEDTQDTFHPTLRYAQTALISCMCAVAHPHACFLLVLIRSIGASETTLEEVEQGAEGLVWR